MNAALNDALADLAKEFCPSAPAPELRDCDPEAEVKSPPSGQEDDGDAAADDEPPDNRRDGDVEEDLDEDCCVWDQKARDRKDKDLQWARDWA